MKQQISNTVFKKRRAPSIASRAFFSLALAASFSLHADLLLNGSFENPDVPPGSGPVPPVPPIIPTAWASIGTLAPRLFDPPAGPGWPDPHHENQYVSISASDFPPPHTHTELAQDFTVSSAGSYMLSWYDNAALSVGGTPYDVQILGAPFPISFPFGYPPISPGAPDNRIIGRPAWNARAVLVTLFPGNYRLVFKAPAVGVGTTLLDNVTLVPNLPNHPPVLNNPDREVCAGYRLEFYLSATDPDGDAVSFSVIEPLPLEMVGATLDAAGRFTWDVGGSLSGAFPVSFTATDSRGLTGDPETINIIVHPPYTISGQPSPQTVLSGGRATFTVSLSGGMPDFEYLWYRGSSPDPTVDPGDLIMPGTPTSALTDTLEIDPVTSADAGFYWVVVKSACGGIQMSTPAALTVSDAPVNHPPVAVAAISPDADLDGGASEIILISVNGVDAPAILDGRMSSDPEGDSLHYNWFRAPAGGSPVPIGEGQTLHARLGIGPHTLFLQVGDGRGGFSTSISIVNVITIDEAIDYLIGTVERSSIVPSLKRDLVRSLLVYRSVFAGRLRVPGRSPCEAGVDGLRFFRLTVQVLSLPRISLISPSQARELNSLVDEIIENIRCE